MNDSKRNDSWKHRPLTRTRRESGAPYTREADVEAQIQRLSALPPRTRQERLTTESGEERLREETLVYALRQCVFAGDEETAWRIAERLVGRISGHVHRQIARWRLPSEEADDCTRDLFAALWDALFDTSPAAEFWEVRFWVCLDRRLWNLIEKRQGALDAQIKPGDQSEDAEEEAAGALLARLTDTGPAPETMALRQAAIARLTDNERMAVYLKYIEGLAEESEDPERVTVARLLGVTGRSVRNYLRRAERKLQDFVNEEP